MSFFVEFYTIYGLINAMLLIYCTDLKKAAQTLAQIKYKVKWTKFSFVSQNILSMKK